MTFAFLLAACLSPTASCTEKLAVQGKTITVFRNFSLSGAPVPEVTRAYVMIHGTNRNADDYFTHALSSALTAGLLESTVVMAPQFKANTGGSCKDALDPSDAGWTCEGWKSGLAAANAPVHSFDYIDALVTLLNDRNRFPNLTSIILAGHSAGGQFMQRYAAASSVPSRLPIRFVVANASSYLYFNALRLPPRASCAVDGRCTAPFGPYSDAVNCTTYNRYKYGLELPEGYIKQADPATIAGHYAAKDVLYMVGAQDNIRDSGLEISCPAMAQGQNRNERGVNFWNYMRDQFKAAHSLTVVTGCGHSAACMFTTPAGARAVFRPMP